MLVRHPHRTWVGNWEVIWSAQFCHRDVQIKSLNAIVSSDSKYVNVNNKSYLLVVVVSNPFRDLQIMSNFLVLRKYIRT